jgi:hypothetical protein
LLKILMNFTVGTFLVITAASTSATPRRAHPRHEQFNQPLIVCTQFGCSDQAAKMRTKSPSQFDANGNVVGRRPDGCPHAFCGCEASLYLFGKIYPDLNLASNWARRFPRTSPVPGTAAVRNHHIMVLISHVAGNDWLVHDGNSDGGLTRDHVTSINGYTIVEPQGSRFVEQER